jgi:hypothetical protein
MNEATIFWVKAESNLNLTQATKLMVALREVSSVKSRFLMLEFMGQIHAIY